MQAPKNRHLKAAIEVGFIIFLFYSNLLMGEFSATAGRGKTLPAALADIFTIKTVAIALVTAVLGHIGFEFLRDKS
jgi:hypothetical protein